MSIKWIARDLYRCQREVEALEKEVAAAAVDKRPILENRLRTARSERDRVRRALDGEIGR